MNRSIIKNMSIGKKTKGKNMNELQGYLVIVDTKKVAWFEDNEKAKEWATENYRGKWLIFPYNIKNKNIFSKTQIKKIKKESEEYKGL